MNGESYNLENLKLHSSIKVMTKFYHPQLQIYRSPCIHILASSREIFRQENLQIMTKQKVIPTHFISSINGTVLLNIKVMMTEEVGALNLICRDIHPIHEMVCRRRRCITSQNVLILRNTECVRQVP